MMRASPVYRNAAMAALQVLVSGGILFVLFYYLLRTIGPVQMGVWSIVLATVSAAHLSELGFSGGVVKFVAQYIGRSEDRSAAMVVETATLSIAGFIGVILIPAYFVLRWLLGHILPAESLADGLIVLPYALVSFWLNSVGGISLAALDGVRRTDLRSIISMAGTAIHLALVFVLVPRYGLVGLAYAQVVQSSVVLITAWSLLRHFMPSLLLIPIRWGKNIFREILSYSLNLQFASLVHMLLDPLTKVLLSKLAGLEVVSYFEMVNRMVAQVRALLVSANQVVVPVIANLHESTPEKIRSIYHDSYLLLLFLALPAYATICALIPVISDIWIGHYEPHFLAFGAIMSIAMFINTMSGPAYFNNLGTGYLRWNTISYAVIGTLNVVAGISLGLLIGAIGVVTGLAIGLVAGAAIVVTAHHVENKIRLSELLPPEHLKLAIACLVSIVAVRSIYYFGSEQIGSLSLTVLSIISLALIISPFLWFHPMRPKIANWVVRGMKSPGLLPR